MTEMGSIFNPGEAEMARQLNSEKILPAPSPVAGDKPLETEDGYEVVIPPLEAPAALPDPPRVKRPLGE